MSAGSLERQIAELRHGEHVCMIYENRAEQMAAAVPFIIHGLNAGECCVYVADDQTIEDVIAALAAAGLNVQAEVDRGALRLLTKKDAYFPNGAFNPKQTIEFLRQTVQEATEAGFPGVRLTGEMTWALGTETGCDRLIEYEVLINEFYSRSKALGLCQYHRQKFAPAMIHDVLRTHPKAILGQQVCTNLYYEPPELVFKGSHEAERVDWMISQLIKQEERVAAHQRAEGELRQSEERFSRFMRHLPGLAWIKNAEGRYVFANDSAIHAFQTTRETLYGRTDPEVFPPETATRFQENDQKALESESGVQIVETLEHADGIVHHSLVTKFPIPSPNGEMALVGGMAIDITEQMEAQKAQKVSERIYRGIGESIDYGIWICDPQGRNIYVSESFLKLVGMTQEECSNYGWGDVLHPDDAARTIHEWKECVRTMGVWDQEHRFKGVDGHYHSILARGVPVFDEHGKVVCWAGINLDISRMKQAEESLREADRRKDEFLAMLAHELRNPLAPIQSGLDLLSLGEATPEVIELMGRQVEHLVRLMDDLLDVSRIMRGKVELRKESVELSQVVARAVETARPLMDAQEHQFTLSLPPGQVWIDGDAVRLAQVVSNLLGNAAKYTNPGGRIWLTAERTGSDVLIHVRDNGIGMEPDFLPKIFDLFTQAERSIDRSQGGLGIGLTVAKSLAELHGGKLSAASEGPGLGSELTIQLPIVERTEAPRLNHSRMSHAPSRRILVVDDNTAAAKMLCLLFSKWGQHEFRMAEDGPKALEIAQEFRPEIVLLDIGLPRMDGYQVARELRHRPESDGVLLVALTGYGSEEDRRRSREAGFDEHFVKPLSYEGLSDLFKHPKLGRGVN